MLNTSQNFEVAKCFVYCTLSWSQERILAIRIQEKIDDTAAVLVVLSDFFLPISLDTTLNTLPRVLQDDKPPSTGDHV